EFKPGPGQPYVSKPTPVRVVDLREGASNVAVTARILAIERREVEVDGNPKAVFSGILADETGKTQFSAWKDFDLKAEEVVRIEGAYVKSWRGIRRSASTSARRSRVSNRTSFRPRAS